MEVETESLPCILANWRWASLSQSSTGIRLNMRLPLPGSYVIYVHLRQLRVSLPLPFPSRPPPDLLPALPLRPSTHPTAFFSFLSRLRSFEEEVAAEGYETRTRTRKAQTVTDEGHRIPTPRTQSRT